jgi:hypothetical protein
MAERHDRSRSWLVAVQQKIINVIAIPAEDVNTAKLSQLVAMLHKAKMEYIVTKVALKEAKEKAQFAVEQPCAFAVWRPTPTSPFARADDLV